MTKNDSNIQLAHGGGGRLSRELINDEIVSRFGNGPLLGLPDAATLPWKSSKLVFTTDSYVVQPIEFPGGNIGDLSVHGTVNDLSVCGSVPKWLSLGLIIEEGFSLSTLRVVLDSIKAASLNCGVMIATGDTKVVGAGQSDGIYINTSGIGEAMEDFNLSPARITPGDVVLSSGNIADHGFAVLAARKNISISSDLKSDTAPVHRLVQLLQPIANEIKFMRDPTRGGISSILNEIVENKPLEVQLVENEIPFSATVRSLSETLGIDPLHVASEGRVVAICSANAAEEVLKLWQTIPEGRDSAMLGTVIEGKGRVTIQTITGGRRIVDLPRGELLPRVC